MADQPEKKTEVVAVDTQGQISIPLDADYVLRPSFTAIRNAEQETGLTLFELASQAANACMSITNLGIVVAAMMRAYGQANPEDPLRSSYVGAKAETLAPMIFEAGVPRIMGRVAIILAQAITGGYTASGELKPTR